MKNGHLEVNGVVDPETGIFTQNQNNLVGLLENQRKSQI